MRQGSQRRARCVDRLCGPVTRKNLGNCEETILEGLFQPMHLVVILFIALLVFGPKKLPELGKGLGDGIRSFKNAMHEKEEVPSQTHATDKDASV